MVCHKRVISYGQYLSLTTGKVLSIDHGNACDFTGVPWHMPKNL